MIVQIGLQCIARIGSIVIHNHDQRITATCGQLFLNNWNEFCRRSPIRFAAQNAKPRNFLEVSGNDILLSLTNRKARKSQNDLVRWARLIEKGTKQWFEIAYAFW